MRQGQFVRAVDATPDKSMLGLSVTDKDELQERLILKLEERAFSKVDGKEVVAKINVNRLGFPEPTVEFDDKSKLDETIDVLHEFVEENLTTLMGQNTE